jgi:hypothetical protein
MKPKAWNSFGTLQEYQIPKEIWGIKLKLQGLTQNLEKLRFSDLSQIDQWKRRSCTKDFVSGVGFEFESFKLLKYRVYYQTLRERMESFRREERNGGENELKTCTINF